MIFYLQALLALILALRVLLVPLPGIRRVLVFALLPTILGPFVTGLYKLAIDYRSLWIGLQMLDWVCLVGVAYSLVTGLFRPLPGVGKVFRRTFSFALPLAVAAAFSAAAFESRYLFGPSIASLMAGAMVLDRAIVPTTGLFLVLILGIVLWSRVQVPKNLAMVSSGVAIHVVIQGIGVVFGDMLRTAGIRFYETATIVWIVFLTYWILFLTLPDGSVEENQSDGQ